MEEIERLVSALADPKNCRMAVRKAGAYRFTSSYRYEAHRHIEYEVNYVNSGNCIMTFEGEHVPLKEGECIVISPWIEHGFLVDAQKGCRITQAEFRVESAEGLGDVFSFAGQTYPYYQIKDCRDVVPLMEQTARLHRAKRNKYQSVQLGLAVIQMILGLRYHIGKEVSVASGIKNEKISEFMKYLQKHYREPLKIEELAEERGISSRYIRKYFLKEIGMSCSDYVTVLRINKAKELLWETGRSVTEIAMEIGYGTPQYFSRIFKEKVGVTPSEYREKWRED